ncbi:Odorant-binding protein 99b-3 [Drosophila ananassae]|uniref:Odorant-binding protein 99b-3 n=1 Tax=Drosophila ananassae TaxID=7217 RepID=B3MTH0_DROAN|nr:general odorant-binding protein 99b [Drosophila ananassae]EDV30560.1 Odorant-binding protein 99b-3 [Drosophila ananassae]
MRVLIVFLVGMVFVLADPHHKHGQEGHYVVKNHYDLDSARKVCAEEIRATEDLVAKYKNPDQAVTLCFLACGLEKFGLYDAEHGFDLDKLYMQLAGVSGHVDKSDELYQKIVQCTESHKEDDYCAKAYHAGTCFMNANLPLVQYSSLQAKEDRLFEVPVADKYN